MGLSGYSDSSDRGEVRGQWLIIGPGEIPLCMGKKSQRRRRETSHTTTPFDSREAPVDPGEALTTSNRIIPQIAGIWKRDGDDVCMRIEQIGSLIKAKFHDTHDSDDLQGVFATLKFYFTTTRTRQESGCRVVFFGTMVTLDENTLQSFVIGTDGGCGFARDWKEDAVYRRQDEMKR